MTTPLVVVVRESGRFSIPRRLGRITKAAAYRRNGNFKDGTYTAEAVVKIGGYVSSCVGVIAVILVLYCSPARAETRVILLRGWFGVFSTGLDAIADALKR